MVISNWQKLAISPQRKRALTIAEAGIKALDHLQVFKTQVFYSSQKKILTLGKEKFKLGKFKHITCVGFGPDSLGISKYLQELLTGQKLPISFVNFDLEDYSNLVEKISPAKSSDLIIFVCAGNFQQFLQGQLSDQDKKIIAALRGSGAGVEEIDTILKHSSLLRGKQLAKICNPATIVSLIFTEYKDISPSLKDQSTVEGASKIKLTIVAG